MSLDSAVSFESDTGAVEAEALIGKGDDNDNDNATTIYSTRRPVKILAFVALVVAVIVTVARYNSNNARVDSIDKAEQYVVQAEKITTTAVLPNKTIIPQNNNNTTKLPIAATKPGGKILPVTKKTIPGTGIKVPEEPNVHKSVLPTKMTTVLPEHLLHNNTESNNNDDINGNHTIQKRIYSLDEALQSLPSGQPLTDLAVRQLQSYRQETGILFNLHVTHHAGTTMCSVLGKAKNARLGVPRYCNFKTNDKMKLGNESMHGIYAPWFRNETQPMIELVREHFHMIAWEYKNAPRRTTLASNDWENPNMFSIYITRHPLSRMLANDGYTHRQYPLLKKDSVHSKVRLEQWQNFSIDDRVTNNFALRVIAGEKCCNGNETSRQYLDNAKETLSRFSVILDISCLTEGLDVLANLTGLIPAQQRRSHEHATIEERFYNSELYEFENERNKLDIELHEWAKERALVNCSALRGE